MERPAEIDDRPTCGNCAYWKDTAKVAIAKRDRLDQLFDSVDGGAGYWRQTSRMVTNRLQRELTKLMALPLSGVHSAYVGAMRDYQKAVSDALDREDKAAALKTQLWEAWTALDDAVPQKESIRKVWEQL
jgi:predicted outer membrane protein